MSNTLDWVRALHRTIMLAQIPHSEPNTPSSKYPSSDLWKGTLGLSITRDLEAARDDDEDDTNMTRFITIDHPGSSGAIFYSVPARRPSMLVDETIDSDSEVDALIERNAVQVLLFPVAATSFITGQVMKAHLLSDPTICPKSRPSGSGFSLNLHALEALSRALQNGSSIPIRDLLNELKPTSHCADRVFQDRRDAARMLLVKRYRDALRNKDQEALRIAARLATRHSTPEEAKLDRLSLDSCGAQAHESLDGSQSSPTLRSNVAIAIATKNTVPLALPTRRHANTLSTVKSSVDRSRNEKKRPKERAGAKGKGKENILV
ncbi:hypothetical protein MSAN_00050000 [Mycena sanguinolenta]|uniref:Uncharacterized protein n=1 Tax=Mycena sanguinolenta TaxID=230812 RepID=A0A8H7DJA9_9AGAR|nr:hypothetical protein MSAN_00050000 [Mycena sanguinolenta]